MPGAPGIFGVCGTSKDTGDIYPEGQLDYNSPRAGVYGETPMTFNAGEIITVEWCANADHGGV